MSKWWSPRLHDLMPYIPGEQPQDKTYIKLNTNESPYPPSPKAIAAIQAEASEDLRLYPDPTHTKLKAAIAEYYQMNPAQVFVGNGSDEVLAHAFVAFFQNNKPICMPDVSYGFYPVYSQLFETQVHTQPLNENLEIDLSSYPVDNGGVLFANPNAPTGQALPASKIETFLQRNTKSVIVIDEAYVDFGAESVVPLVAKYPNLLVVQTFSKSRALAGLRVGFAIGSSELIEGLERVKNSFNPYPLSREAQAGAAAAIADVEYFDEIRQRTIATREHTTQEMRAMGYEVLPSKTNFILVKKPNADAEKTYLRLKDKGVLVRYFASPTVLADCMRISIGTDEEMDVMLDILETRVHT